MDALIDSRKQQLTSKEILPIAFSQTPSKYPVDALLPATLAEMSQPNSDVKQIGNTIFSVHMSEKNTGIFKTFNADIIPNYVKNGKLFCAYAFNSLKLNYLVTFDDNQNILKLLQSIMQNPPMQGMNLEPIQLQDGSKHFVLQLGQKSGGL